MPTISREQMRADIAEATGLEPEQIEDETNLRDAGLDSIRLMTLVEKWRAAGVQGADFVALASSPTLGAWLAEFSVDAAADAQTAR
ncbi:phosphopantetheine-binding protein [Streptomyces sp. NPDC055815]